MKNSLEIKELLREFYKISGFRISIHDTEFNEIYAYPQELSPYCAAIQTDIHNKIQCIRNDEKAFKKVRDSGEMEVYRCSHGLYEVVAPLYHYGIISGFLMMGQVCDNKIKYSQQLIHSLKKISFEDKTISQIVTNIKEVPEKLLNSYIMLMRVIAEYVTQTNRIFYGNDNYASLVMKYIKQNYSSKITLDLLSEKFSCSQSTLVKAFKKEYSTTIMSELMNIRLEKAEQYLKNSRLSVKEISDKCGFSEQNYFSKAFTKKYNIPPSKYRDTM